MTNAILANIKGLRTLWEQTLGDSRICVAVLDGVVDETHPCFSGANLSRLPSLVSEQAGNGIMSGHGTHISSVIFGQHDVLSPIQGIAPRCRGLIIPIFSDSQGRKLSQIDLARAINQAVEAGANVINISGGELSQSGQADPILEQAVRFCNDEGVLIVAAAGNNGCDCLHVPAALPSVLAVGAMDAQGLPIDYSNWGNAYQMQGILALGENILGAESGGGISQKSGTSFATPIVSGIVALLLSIQLARGEKPNPHGIREAILKSALPCNPEMAEDCRRFLAGSLNIPGAYALITKGETKEVLDEQLEETVIQPSEANVLELKETNPTDEIGSLEPSEANDLNREEVSLQSSEMGIQAAQARTSESSSTTIQNSGNPMQVTSSNVATVGASSATNGNVVPSADCGCNGGAVASFVTPSNAPRSLVYAIGTIGYDFGTEARRDSFKQLMPGVRSDNYRPFPSNPPDPLPSGVFAVPANPYDARQMANYLRNAFNEESGESQTPSYENIPEAASLIWTLNLELTPIYAIKPNDTFALSVYKCLADFLDAQVLDKNDEYYIERVAIPGTLTGETVTLFSGQVVPVIKPLNTRGMYGWRVNQIVAAVIERIQQQFPPGATRLTAQQEAEVEYSLENFLMRLYYDLRNLGQTSQERAQNFATTNIVQAADALVKVLSNQSRTWIGSTSSAVTMQLQSLEVERSPFCRKDSDCWDVKIRFFDPENVLRAKRVIRYTIDVSDIMPVTLGEVRLWDEA